LVNSTNPGFVDMDKPTENALAIIGPHKPKAKTADQPLPLDGQTIDAEAKTITIDLTSFEGRIGSLGAETVEQSAQSTAEKRIRWEKLSPLAASFALAALLGILAGTAATVTLMPAPAAAVAAASDETRGLQDKVAKLSGDLAALKSGLETANRSATTQLNRIGERLERAEKAQAEPSAKLARIMETLDRLDRRTAPAALPASAPVPDITGSATSIEKQQVKPPALEGWRLRDVYAGRAVLESRTGTLYEVGPGSMLPGVGKVETIKRVDGKFVITTPKGTITAALEPPRRPGYHLPPGY
jgi:hypothetical protein